MTWIWWVGVVVALVIIGFIGQRLGIMNFKTDKDWRRTSGNLLGPIDGLFAPNRQEALQEQERQTELPAPAPAPGDPMLDLENGIVVIDVSERRNSGLG